MDVKENEIHSSQIFLHLCRKDAYIYMPFVIASISSRIQRSCTAMCMYYDVPHKKNAKNIRSSRGKVFFCLFANVSSAVNIPDAHQ